MASSPQPDDGLLSGLTPALVLDGLTHEETALKELLALYSSELQRVQTEEQALRRQIAAVKGGQATPIPMPPLRTDGAAPANGGDNLSVPTATATLLGLFEEEDEKDQRRVVQQQHLHPPHPTAATSDEHLQLRSPMLTGAATAGSAAHPPAVGHDSDLAPMEL